MIQDKGIKSLNRVSWHEQSISKEAMESSWFWRSEPELLQEDRLQNEQLYAKASSPLAVLNQGLPEVQEPLLFNYELEPDGSRQRPRGSSLHEAGLVGGRWPDAGYYIATRRGSAEIYPGKRNEEKGTEAAWQKLRGSHKTRLSSEFDRLPARSLSPMTEESGLDSDLQDGKMLLQGCTGSSRRSSQPIFSLRPNSDWGGFERSLTKHTPDPEHLNAHPDIRTQHDGFERRHRGLSTGLEGQIGMGQGISHGPRSAIQPGDHESVHPCTMPVARGQKARRSVSFRQHPADVHVEVFKTKADTQLTLASNYDDLDKPFASPNTANPRQRSKSSKQLDLLTSILLPPQRADPGSRRIQSTKQVDLGEARDWTLNRRCSSSRYADVKDFDSSTKADFRSKVAQRRIESALLASKAAEKFVAEAKDAVLIARHGEALKMEGQIKRIVHVPRVSSDGYLTRAAIGLSTCMDFEDAHRYRLAVLLLIVAMVMFWGQYI